jgi:hypothetical protein
LQLRYEQRIELAVTGDDRIAQVVRRYSEYLGRETLAARLLPSPPPDVPTERVEIEGRPLTIAVRGL